MKTTLSMMFLMSLALIIQAGPLTEEKHWHRFKEEHGRLFSNVESRKPAFLTAKAAVDQHNAEADQGLHSYYQDVNQFSVMTEEEMEIYRTKVPGEVPAGAQTAQMSRLTPPESLDLRNCSCMPAVKDQGGCGAGWAFSATNPIEFQYCCLNKLPTPLPLSEQQFVDCSTYNSGCIGGSPAKLYQDLIDHRTLQESFLTYPYYSGTTKMGGTCYYKYFFGVAKVSSYTVIPSGSSAVTLMKQALATYGPVSVSLQASSDWTKYQSGIFSGSCSDWALFQNHAATVVGYGSQNGVNYWIVRNSWGSSWGQGGYILMKQGINQCAIEIGAVYPVVKL